MNISTKTEGGKLTIGLEGRLDTTSAPQLEGVLRETLRGVTELEMDFEKLAYISSAGLRVLLSAMKLMKKQGSMVVRNVNETVMEVFEITGFADMLTIE
ncbi:MAG: STAS domain-containing protein [Clostridia bacterium]|nr:STAS domain-containing protein [Clostridia bacterium]